MRMKQLCGFISLCGRSKNRDSLRSRGGVNGSYNTDPSNNFQDNTSLGWVNFCTDGYWANNATWQNSEPQAWEFYAVTDYDEVATSISGTDEQVQVKAIYSVNGTVQRGMKKGVNIVKMSDGSVKKVLVK